MTTETAVATTETLSTSELMERVVIVGDLAKLAPEHRVAYYRETCRSLGLNPLTKPFQYIVLNGKLTLYATRTATDQLRAIKGISIDRIEQVELGELYIATVYGHDRDGRTDSEVGAVPIANLKGENRANAIMKAITKAKRRLTLALAGLGWLDETEVGSVPSAQSVEVDMETGEVTQPLATVTETIAARRAAITSGPSTTSVPQETAGSVVELARPVEEVRDDPQGEPPPPAGAIDATPARSEAGSAFEGKPTPANICGALPPDDNPLEMTAPCELRGAHKVHRSSHGTWSDNPVPVRGRAS